MAMARVRLSPSASVTITPAGVMLRSDLGTIQISGADVRTFVDRIVPLCDGTRDRDAIRAALAEYSARSVDAFLDLLQKRRLIEEVADTEAPEDERWRGQEEFLRRWPGVPDNPMARLRAARSMVVGLEPWGATLAVELAAAGASAIHLVEDDVTRRETVADRIRGLAPWCRVDVSAMTDLDEKVVASPDLLLAALPPEDEAVVERVARYAHRARVPSLWSQVTGGSMLAVGPLVIPGKTACRVCAGQACLNPALAGAGATWAPAAVTTQMLGHLAALEAVKMLTGYAPSALAGRVLGVDPATMETTLQTLVRLPWCPVCGG
jgi:molybdopterin/thiamine biosynthesis adenylyltransferase